MKPRTLDALRVSAITLIVVLAVGGPLIAMIVSVLSSQRSVTDWSVLDTPNVESIGFFVTNARGEVYQVTARRVK